MPTTLEDSNKILSLADAARLSPLGAVSPQSIWRWIRFGVRGIDGQTVRLGSVKVGRRIGTTAALLDEFFRAAGSRTTSVDVASPQLYGHECGDGAAMRAPGMLCHSGPDALS